jgi:putative ATP-dependent endonuclease of OLD family
MKLRKIFIKNYMSIGSNHIEINLENNSKIVLVGENNVGKSSIFKALNRCLNYQETAFSEEEWHKSDRNKTIEISLELSLEDEDIIKILAFLELPEHMLDEVKQNFGQILIYDYKKSLGTSRTHLKWGRLSIIDNMGSISDTEIVPNYIVVQWSNIKSIKEKSPTRTIIGIIDEEVGVQKKRKPGMEIGIVFNSDVRNNIIGMLKDSIVLFPEFREMSQKSLTNLLVSSSGRDLASVLLNLKDGRQKEREKFREIQQYFTKLFPRLELEVIRESNEIKISTTKDGIESTTGFFGAGISEMVLFITHLIAHEDKILCIDEPESHLHPHTQKLLANLISNSKSQVILTTHSPYFITLGNRIIKTSQKDSQTILIGHFNDIQPHILQQILDGADSKEIFFAKKVLLVEGHTETGALPVFSKEIFDFDINGVSILSVGGKTHFEPFIKLMENYEIPYFILADKDAEKEIRPFIGKYPHLKYYLLPVNDFLELFDSSLIDEAKRTVGVRSKSRQGRYIAERILQQKQPVPKEIEDILNLVKECKW